MEVVTADLTKEQNLRVFFSKQIPGTKAVTGYSLGVGGRPSIQFLKNSGLVGPSSPKISRVEINFDSGGRAVIFKNKIIISGTFPYQKVIGNLTEFIPGIMGLMFKVAAGTYSSSLLYKVSLTKAFDEFKKNPKPGWSFDMDTDRSKFVRLIIKTKVPKATIFVFSTGSIIINGTGFDPQKLEVELFDLLEDYDSLRGEEFTTMPIPVRKNLVKKKTNMMNARYPLGGPGTPEKGMYVRPGPNKQLRIYKVPANPTYVRTKVLKAYADAGINVPNHVRILFGLSPPKKKKATTPSKTYMRPGPNGKMKEYKIPKGLAAGRTTMMKAYAKAGQRIPTPVRKIFGVNSSPTQKSPERITGNVTKRGVFRINELACKRRTLEQIQGIAKKLEVPWSKLTKDKLCRAIQVKLMGLRVNTPPRANFRLGNTNHFLVRNSQKVRRVTGTKESLRALMSFKLTELKNFAKAKGVSENGTKALIISRILGGGSPASSVSSLGSLQSLANLIARSPSPLRRMAHANREYL